MSFDKKSAYKPKTKDPDGSRLELPKDGNEMAKAVHCPSCGEKASSDDLNIQEMIGKCSSCNSIYNFQETVESLQDKSLIVNEASIKRPAGIDLFSYKGNLEISMDKDSIWLDFLALIFVMIVFLLMGLVSKGRIPQFVPYAVATLPIVYLFFRLLSPQKMKDEISIDEEKLVISSKPSFLVKDKVYKIEDVDQIYHKLNKDIGYYDVFAIINAMEGQKNVKIISNIKNVAKVQFLEQEIEAHLGIKNRVVPQQK